MSSRDGRRDVAIVAVGAAVAIALVVIALSSGTDRESTIRRPDPAPIVVGGDGGAAPARELSEGELVGARRTAGAFMRSYLPVLYGRAKPAELVVASAHLRRSLRGAQRPPRSVRRRKPQVQNLELTIQSSRSVLATATVDDAVAAPFRVLFTVELRDGGWVVTDLASD